MMLDVTSNICYIVCIMWVYALTLTGEVVCVKMGMYLNSRSYGRRKIWIGG